MQLPNDCGWRWNRWQRELFWPEMQSSRWGEWEKHGVTLASGYFEQLSSKSTIGRDKGRTACAPVCRFLRIQGRMQSEGVAGSDPPMTVLAGLQDPSETGKRWHLAQQREPEWDDGDIAFCLRLQGRQHSETEGFGSFQTRVIARGHQGPSPWLARLADHAISQPRAMVWSSSVPSPCPLSTVHTASLVWPTHPAHPHPHPSAKTITNCPPWSLSESGRRIPSRAWGMCAWVFRRQHGGWSPGSSAIERGLTRATVAVPMAIANGDWTIPSRQMQQYPTPKSPAAVGTRTDTDAQPTGGVAAKPGRLPLAGVPLALGV